MNCLAFCFTLILSQKPYINRCVFFQIMSNQQNLSQVDSIQGVGTFQRWTREWKTSKAETWEWKLWGGGSVYLLLAFYFFNKFAKLCLFWLCSSGRRAVVRLQTDRGWKKPLFLCGRRRRDYYLRQLDLLSGISRLQLTVGFGRAGWGA